MHVVPRPRSLTTLLYTKASVFIVYPDSSISNTCQNTEQGDTIIADETGALCSRDLILPSGCCPDPSEGKDTGTHRFVCDQCNADHCCGIYEHCVSCCLDQRHVALRLQVLKASQSSSRHLSLASTPFEFCASICRTSSRSVVHENTYRDWNSRFCFGLQSLSTVFQSSPN
ncbi:unnamed protein product [Dicrocoelium dendriticum]|nr:unnamed protein product [Dicrocoelium dendriticum]